MVIVNVVIIGGGPAGIGIASLLNQTDLDYIVLEKNEIGSSFLKWSKNMEMITPFFPSNALGQIDLNSICESTSPAFSFNKEHLSGDEYSKYLEAVNDYFQINVQTNTEVKKVHQKNGHWLLETNKQKFYCKYLIWAAGEFQNPQIKNIIGAKHCVHSSLIKDPELLEGTDFAVIGGYESGVQMAFSLINNNKKVALINPYEIDEKSTSDPSRVLSPYSHAKYEVLKKSNHYKEIIDEVIKVSKNDEFYNIHLKSGAVFQTEEKPISATGFSLLKKPFEKFINYREDGSPLLIEETDEFFGQENIYLAGPDVKHDNHIFCFIYKFRQRFGIIAENIIGKEGYHEDDISSLVENWKSNGMYLSDLSCCDEECVC